MLVWLHQPSFLKALRRGWVVGANPAYGRDACTDARVRSTPAGETIRVPPRIRGRHDPLPAFRPDDRAAGRRDAAGLLAAATRSRGHGHHRADALRHRARGRAARGRSEEHTSELQSPMRISYAVFCLKQQTNKENESTHNK